MTKCVFKRGELKFSLVKVDIEITEFEIVTNAIVSFCNVQRVISMSDKNIYLWINGNRLHIYLNNKLISHLYSISVNKANIHQEILPNKYKRLTIKLHRIFKLSFSTNTSSN